MTKTVHGYIYRPFSVHSRNYLAHARAVDTRPFLLGWEGPGYEANVNPPPAGSLPGSASLRTEVQTVHHLHVLVGQLHLPHGREVVCLQCRSGLVPGTPDGTRWLGLRGGWAEHSHDHRLELLVVLAESWGRRGEGEEVAFDKKQKDNRPFSAMMSWGKK